MKKHFTKRNILFIALFAVLGLLALQVPVTQLAGSKAKFTLFDFFGPVATGFIGTLPGIIAVFLMQFINFLIHGAQAVDAGTIIRFFPMLFAAWYFGSKSRFNWIVPVLAIAAWLAHPIGRTVWYYAMFWLIPIVMYFARDRFLLARALGATFSAHAVGGALWIWVFALPKAVWVGLIPVVAMERALFALGIAVTYVVLNNALAFLVKRQIVRWEFLVNPRYVYGQKV
ncbi:hypothetical protein HYW17_02465 [Candidatus Uhrbacteria bacterium]|nr:hypothetical protein [Candidatus Uhrbacteria bacterium]